MGKVKGLIQSIVVLSILTLTVLSGQAVQAETLKSYEVKNGVITSNKVTLEASSSLKASEVYAGTLDAFRNEITNAIIAGQQNVYIVYTGSTNDSEYIKNIIDDILVSAGNDYEKTLINAYRYSVYTNPSVSGFQINLEFTYIETKDQVEAVKTRVNEILGQIITPGMTEVDKVKAINAYIVTHLQYDTSLVNYSAYDGLFQGKTVCQGYALLAYRMLTMAGLDARIVVGDANGGGHAWNLVKVGGNWYHLDTTWDDPVPDEQGRVLTTYLLLSDSQIEDTHTWDKSHYPACTTDYSAIKQADKLYAEAYSAVTTAMSDKTQKSVNVARVAIEELRGTGADWAIGEFSKQVDMVQHPILVRFVNAYNEAVSALSKVTDNPSYVDPNNINGISVQSKIEAARIALDPDMPAIWRSSYSSGLDKVQQDYQVLALARYQSFKQSGSQGKAQCLSMLQDMYNNTTNADLKVWCNTIMNEIANNTL